MVKDIKKSVTLSCILFLFSGAPDQEITFTAEIKKERVRLYGYRCTHIPSVQLYLLTGRVILKTEPSRIEYV